MGSRGIRSAGVAIAPCDLIRRIVVLVGAAPTKGKAGHEHGQLLAVAPPFICLGARGHHHILSIGVHRAAISRAVSELHQNVHDRPRARLGALHGLRDGLGDFVAADPRLCPVGRCSGGRDQGRDEPTPARFLVALDRDRDRARGRVVVLFLRGCGARAIDLPQGGRFHCGDGLPVRLDQSGPRTRDHHRCADRLAIRRRRVRGRLDNGRAADRHAARRHEAPI